MPEKELSVKTGMTFTNEYRIVQDIDGLYYLEYRNNSLDDWSRYIDWIGYEGKIHHVAYHIYEPALTELRKRHRRDLEKFEISQTCPRVVYTMVSV